MEKLSLKKFEDFSTELNHIYGGRNVVQTAVVTGCDDGTTEPDGTESDDLSDISISAEVGPSMG
jgi:hypothetical protein